ncbi:hypothetical protein SO802_023207 [Lithocarpus litseifolius]|uniref:C2H2-type domain-containing protein n=1 Tax=Lithocarpus litseifolius TaxID=425828 RepID=A0AAW2C5N8_9ROSI
MEKHLGKGGGKGKWDSNNFSFEEDHSCGVSWPAKQVFTCNFCKRQFRSAQALGGHMNVHRKDRARLRLLPSSSSDSHNPNPNFTSSPSSSSSKFLPYTHHPLPFFSSPSSSSIDEEKKLELSHLPLNPQGRNNMNKKRIIGGILGLEELRGTFAQKDELKVLKKEDTIKLGLEIGLLKDPQESLDLELRLGFF